jgi:hypothetical protein
MTLAVVINTPSSRHRPPLGHPRHRRGLEAFKDEARGIAANIAKLPP